MDAVLACMKYVLFAINFMIWCFGGALAGIGLWIRTDGDFWEYHKGFHITNYYEACYIIMAAGVVLLVLGFCGCCGVANDNPCMITTYIVIMSLLLILEMAAAGLAWKLGSGDKLQEYLTEEILEKIHNRRNSIADRDLIDKLQMHLECCGANHFGDYGNDQIPQSCSSDRTNNLFIYGCGEHLRRLLEQKAGTVGGIVLSIGLIQIISVVFTACLLIVMKQDGEDL